MSLDPRLLFAEPLDPLDATDPTLRDILVPRSLRDAPRRGVTDQFLAHAADYHERYGNVDYFRSLIDGALMALEPPLAPRTILDIGSGSGNSVIPLLDRYPEAFVVAVDISPQLLAILRDHLAGDSAYAGRYALVCMDASNDVYRPGTFDLAVGAAVLHHVLEPARVIDACDRALRPQGVALFFEPFEPGHALLRLAYADILAEAERRGEAGPALALVRKIHRDYVARGSAHAGADYAALDDKWMFTRGWFEAAARRGDWASCAVHPIHDTASPLSEQTRTYLKLELGADASVLAPWAWQRLAAYEAAFSDAARADLPLEAAVLLRAGARPRGTRTGWWWNAAESGRGFFVEVRDETARIACCAYDAEGRPVWYAAGPAAIVDDAVHAIAVPLQLTPASPQSRGTPLALRFDGPRAATLEWGDTRIPLTLQHDVNPGLATPATDSLGGWWQEDDAAPDCALLIESLGDRLVAALLTPGDWCYATVERRAGRVYRGAWLRFQGGQALGEPYRAPAAPEDLGEARIAYDDTDRMVVRLPGGRFRAFARG